MDREQFFQWIDQIYTTSASEIDCEQFQLTLPAFVDLESAGEDLGARAAPFKAHLAQCPDCADEYAGLRAVAELEARGRLPKAEESLAKFEAEAAPEADEARVAT